MKPFINAAAARSQLTATALLATAQVRSRGLLRLGCWLGLAGALTVLAACGQQSTEGAKAGWYLEKTGDTAVQLVQVSAAGGKKTWPGVLHDDSPHGTFLNPLKRGQDNGLFRWSMPGCTELSFVLTREDLVCTTCMDPAPFTRTTATCALDQQRLPIQGWVPVGLERPR